MHFLSVLRFYFYLSLSLSPVRLIFFFSLIFPFVCFYDAVRKTLMRFCNPTQSITTSPKGFWQNPGILLLFLVPMIKTRFALRYLYFGYFFFLLSLCCYLVCEARYVVIDCYHKYLHLDPHMDSYIHMDKGKVSNRLG